MPKHQRRRPNQALGLALSLLLPLGFSPASAQSLGGAGTLRGTVRDASGAPIPSAGVELSNRITGYSLAAQTGPEGTFAINRIPPNTYRLLVRAAGFQEHGEDLRIRTGVPIDPGPSAR